jgi:hypothetical protein
MRWFVALVFVLALGTLRIVGCGETEPEPECYDHWECDDSNECTVDRCTDESVCAHEAVPDPAERAVSRCLLASDVYFESGICVSGECVKPPCDDPGDPCTGVLFSIQEGQETCTLVAMHFDPCDWNGEVGVCNMGVCQEDLCKEPCDDGNACTTDTCDPFEGCRYAPRGCSDSDACTQDLCDPETGCYNPAEPDGTVCCTRSEPDCSFFDCSIYRCIEWGACDNGVCEEVQP